MGEGGEFKLSPFAPAGIPMAQRGAVGLYDSEPPHLDFSHVPNQHRQAK